MTRPAYYLDSELPGDDVFAISHIAVAPDIYTSAPAFTVVCIARVDRLRFYVVAKNYGPAGLAFLQVADAGLGNPDVPRCPVPLAMVFSALPDAAVDADALPTTLRTGSRDALAVVESAEHVPHKQRPLRRVRLMRNQKELIANLRQPGADQPDAALIIHVSKP